MLLQGQVCVIVGASSLRGIGYATAELFADTCFNIPTLGELFKLASLDAISRLRTGRSLVDLPALQVRTLKLSL